MYIKGEKNSRKTKQRINVGKIMRFTKLKLKKKIKMEERKKKTKLYRTAKAQHRGRDL